MQTPKGHAVLSWRLIWNTYLKFKVVMQFGLQMWNLNLKILIQSTLGKYTVIYALLNTTIVIISGSLVDKDLAY